VCYAYACTLQGEIAAGAKGMSTPALSAGTMAAPGARGMTQGGPGPEQAGPMMTAAEYIAQEEEANRARAAREAEARGLFTSSALYICLAHALQPGKDIYRKSLGVVKQLLPLPFLKAGHLTAPLPATRGTHSEAWRRDWYVLDQVSLRAGSSGEGHGPGSHASLPGAPQAPMTAPECISVPLAAVVATGRGADPSLPQGAALWVQVEGEAQALWLVAEDEDAADAWADAIALSAHIVRCRSPEALAAALAPVQQHHHHGLGLGAL